MAFCLSSRNSRFGNNSVKDCEPKIKFNLECIQYWANQYDYQEGRKEQFNERVEQVRNRAYLTKCDLKAVCEWKSPRFAGNYKINEKSFVNEVTRFALSTKCDRAAIESLTILDGVGVPTASTILHFFHEKGYPILDFRALWSVSLIDDKKYKYEYAKWSKYVKYCRAKADEAGVSMWDLDCALWQYSKKCKQP